jgi:hypothetical protein
MSGKAKAVPKTRRDRVQDRKQGPKQRKTDAPEVCPLTYGESGPVSLHYPSIGDAMPHFIEVRGGGENPQIQILDLEKVWLVVEEWAEGGRTVTVHSTGGASTRFSHQHGAEQFLSDFREYLLTL